MSDIIRSGTMKKKYIVESVDLKELLIYMCLFPFFSNPGSAIKADDKISDTMFVLSELCHIGRISPIDQSYLNYG